jgi:hypothetical protein
MRKYSMADAAIFTYLKIHGGEMIAGTRSIAGLFEGLYLGLRSIVCVLP